MLKVRDIMTRDVITVTPDTTLRETIDLLSARQVSGLAVVSGTEVVGVVSTTDILAAAATSYPNDADLAAEDPDAEDPFLACDPEDEPAIRYFTDLWMDAGQNVATRGTEPAALLDLMGEQTVGDIMTRRVVSVAPNVDVRFAAERMRREAVHRVVVLDDGALVGIVTAMDLAGMVARGGCAA